MQFVEPKEGILPKRGTKVKIKDKIAEKGACEGFLVNPKHLDARSPGAYGSYKDFVPGAGGDVWWVEHEPGKVAAYMFDEVLVAQGGEGGVTAFTDEEIGSAALTICAHITAARASGHALPEPLLGTLKSFAKKATEALDHPMLNDAYATMIGS